VLFRSEHPYGLGAPQQLLLDAFDYLQVRATPFCNNALPLCLALLCYQE
jgi:hypothetical protein